MTGTVTFHLYITLSISGPLAQFTSTGSYSLTTKTTSENTLRLLRALQLPRPILLEGSPGVGKTSLATALAKFSGHPFTRINLSEQTVWPYMANV